MLTVGHRPLYCTEKEFSDANGNVVGSAKHLKDVFEQDWKANKVDMMVCGHAHVYERQYPIYNGTIETKNPTNYTDLSDPLYLISGAGGCLGGLDKDHDFNRGIPWSFMSYNKEQGFGVLKVKRDKINRRQVTVNWQFFNDKGDLVDQFTLTKTK